MKALLYILFGFIVGVVLCNATSFGNKLQKQSDSIEIIDTFIIFNDVYVTDTIYQQQIVSVPKYVNKEIVINDTTYIEKKHQDYKDSTDSYDITINCTDFNYYQLNIHRVDTLRFRDTLNIPIIEKKQKPKRFGLGLQVGAGYSPNNNQISPYVGVGISYNLLNF